MREIEIKYKVDSIEDLLTALRANGIYLSAPVVQDDQAYAPRTWAYGDSKVGVSFVRLRTIENSHTFTLKRPVENSLSCEEYETHVADRAQMHESIIAMGFHATVRISKTRRHAKLGDIVICVDEVDGLGTFIELEKIVSGEVSGELVQKDLADFFSSLGINAVRIYQTYDSMIREAKEVASGGIAL